MPNASIVKVENGNVKIFTASGSGLHQFRVGSGPQEAIGATLAGDEIHVTRADGRIVVCTHSGSQKRTI